MRAPEVYYTVVYSNGTKSRSGGTYFSLAQARYLAAEEKLRCDRAARRLRTVWRPMAIVKTTMKERPRG